MENYTCSECNKQCADAQFCNACNAHFCNVDIHEHSGTFYCLSCANNVCNSMLDGTSCFRCNTKKKFADIQSRYQRLSSSTENSQIRKDCREIIQNINKITGQY